MTEREKMNFSDKLFDEIGLIDDRFIYEANTPYISRSRRGWSIATKMIAIAAAIALTFCLSVGALLTGALFVLGGIGNDDSFVDPPPSNNVTNDMESYTTLSSRLDSLSTSGTYATVSGESLDLFDARPKIIWQKSGEKEYTVHQITNADAAALTEKMRSNSGSSVLGASQNYRSETLVWIALGDGRVITPHLAFTSGNVGYGELFEYEQEYEPSEEFSALLIDTIS